jgi:uncharacterized protein YmfQ (DUF2313 family)
MKTHTDLLRQLLPASYNSIGRVLTASLSAEGNALDNVALYANQLLIEADPRTALGLIPAWERVLGSALNSDTAVRRATLQAKLNELGGQDAAYFIALAATLGFVISITEFQPSSIMADVLLPMFTPEWYFVWQVNVNAGWNYAYAQADIMATVTDAFARWNQNQDFEALLREDAPAHTQLLFAYH